MIKRVIDRSFSYSSDTFFYMNKTNVKFKIYDKYEHDLTPKRKVTININILNIRKFYKYYFGVVFLFAQLLY